MLAGAGGRWREMAGDGDEFACAVCGHWSFSAEAKSLSCLLPLASIDGVVTLPELANLGKQRDPAE